MKLSVSKSCHNEEPVLAAPFGYAFGCMGNLLLSGDIAKDELGDRNQALISHNPISGFSPYVEMSIRAVMHRSQL